ncbi:hypothetical protein [Caulifigura coniformis]|nr:hypothetical protein [Caulifigura coniformis]
MGFFTQTGVLRCLRLATVAAAIQCSAVNAAEPNRVAQTSAEEEAFFDAQLLQPTSAGVHCPPNPCPPNPCPPNPCPPNVMQPDQVFQPTPTPLTAPPQAPQSQFSSPPSVASLQAGQGAISGQDYVPSVFGDFYAGPGTTISSVPSGGVVAIPRGNSVGLMKFAENASVIPRDRFYVNYSYFDDVSLIPGGLDVRRLTPGVEKTLLDGALSLELRVPMATTLNSTTPFDTTNLLVSGYDTTSYELGNLTGFFKALLFQNEVWAVSTGLGIALPTADDLRVVSDDGARTTLDLIKNESVHLLPFIGGVFTPTERLFFQGVIQVDAATRGNSVYTADDSLALVREGRLDDPNYLFVSLSGGYWIYQASDPSSLISRIALISELHSNNTLGRTDAIAGDNANISNRVNIQTLNAVFGSNVLIDENKSLMLGYVAPIGGGSDRAFDGEFRVMFNWYFGPLSTRASRAQF